MTIRWAPNVYRPAIHLETVNRDKSRSSSPPRSSTVPVKTWENFSIWRHLVIFTPDFRIRQMMRVAAKICCAWRAALLPC